MKKYILALTHELKSPLTAIQASAALVNEKMPPEDQRKFLDTIGTEAKRIDHLVNPVLSLAGIEKQVVLGNIERVQLSELVMNVVNSQMATAKQRGIRCMSDLDSSIFVEGDRLLLTQAVDNLLMNAIAFSPDDGVIQLVLSLDSRREGWLNLNITDQGPGIPDYAIDRIYERFYSLPRPKTNKKSSGLGLSFVRQIMELHGGDVRLLNEPGAGARAILFLPVANIQTDL